MDKTKTVDKVRVVDRIRTADKTRMVDKVRKMIIKVAEPVTRRSAEPGAVQRL